MGIVIRNINEDRFEVDYRPGYGWAALTIMAFVFFAMLLAVSKQYVATLLLAVACVVVAIAYVYYVRSHTVAIDRGRSEVEYWRGGLLGSHRGASITRLAFAGVAGVEIKRHTSRGRDTFQVRIRALGGGIVPLTGSELGFRESQVLAGQVGAFMGLAGEPQAVD